MLVINMAVRQLFDFRKPKYSLAIKLACIVCKQSAIFKCNSGYTDFDWFTSALFIIFYSPFKCKYLFDRYRNYLFPFLECQKLFLEFKRRSQLKNIVAQVNW